MNRNKSLVIATGYRKKFVDIEEILKSIDGQSSEDSTVLSDVTKETNEDGGSIWYATVNDGNNDIQVPLFASRVKKVYSDYDNENASLILDPSIYNVVEMDSDGTVNFNYVYPLPDELENSDALSTFNEECYEKFALIPIVGRITINGTNNITFPDNLEYAASNPDFETGHLYEFNIFDGIINIIDVTTT